jgi:L-ascorbate metabolism protein UlaG (beta-lactamase superfamily)
MRDSLKMPELTSPSIPAANLLGPAQKQGEIFLNPVPTVVMRPGSFGRTLRRLATQRRQGDPERPIGPFQTDPAVYANPSADGLRVTWMGHSTLLIEIDGHRILTDPVWSDRASFTSWMGPKRFYPPTISLEALPPLDAILISHDHYDHLDTPTVRRLADLLRQTPAQFICSIGVGRFLGSCGIERSRISELNWGGSASIQGAVQISATPARHFSGRGLWGRNRTLWSSFVIRGNRHNIFFGADSGMFPGFKTIGDTFGPFDLTMLEIGAYGADWPDIHMGPANAVQAHIALQGKLLLPIHWGLFNLAFHPWREPVEWAMREAERHGVSLLLPEPGAPSEVSAASPHSFWWEA